MRQRLHALPPLQRSQEEELVNAFVMGTKEWQAASRVLLYAAKPPELSVTSLGNAAFRVGKEVALPRVMDGRLELCSVAGWRDLVPGAFGILEPASHCEPVALADVDLAVIPGVAFTQTGDRLGQGGGYYDRLLARQAAGPGRPGPGHRPPVWGVAFEAQLVASLPVEPHDVQVDAVFTQADALGASAG